MWICAKCGTEAQKPETCSGCGSAMKPFDQPPKEDRYNFVLITSFVMRTKKDHVMPIKGFDVYGPFPNVMAADAWADATLKHTDYEVVLMEDPTQ